MMKLQQKSILILFLLISSSIISVHSNIKYSTFSKIPSDSIKLEKYSENNDGDTNISEELSYYETDDRNFLEESSINSLQILMIDNVDQDFSSKSEAEKSFVKLLNFIVGMMTQIKEFRKFAVVLEGVIENATNPECSKEKLMEEFYQPHITAEMRREATNESIQDFIGELGQTSDVKKIDWSNPREACKTVRKLYTEKLNEATKFENESKTLLELSEKALNMSLTYEQFEKKEGGIMWQMFHLQTSKLINFIKEINFNGDIIQMRETYKDYEKWKRDLIILIDLFRESKEAAEKIKDSLKIRPEAIVSCDELPKTNELQAELPSFSEQFIGGLYVLKRVAICLNVTSLVTGIFIGLSIKRILGIIGNIFGLYVVQLIYYALYLYDFSSFLYKGLKTDENTKLDKKYRFYGKAAGAMYNLIERLLLK